MFSYPVWSDGLRGIEEVEEDCTTEKTLMKTANLKINCGEKMDI